MCKVAIKRTKRIWQGLLDGAAGVKMSFMQPYSKHTRLDSGAP